ncbi:MAG: Ig-like domain-containing protein, partial [Elusimicrobia bacterium]|nr:Ig-like domain-containing protein [Elusimicrobiota bacterium]
DDSSPAIYWTSATVPPRPEVESVNKYSLRVIFSPGDNPTTGPQTQFAIQAYEIDPNDTGQEQKFLKTNVSSNAYSLDGGSISDDAVWKTYSAWDPYGVVIASGLISSHEYHFAIYARNGDAGSDPKIPTEASQRASAFTGSGDPIIRVNTRVADGRNWINTTIVSFTATGSYHYHYIFTPQRNIYIQDTAPGWNGKLLSTADLANDGSEHSAADVLPVSGFKAMSEEDWTLYVLGDDYLSYVPNSGHGTQRRAAFVVSIDTQAPIVPNLKAKFGPNDPTPIGDSAEIAHSKPYFYWDEPTNGKPGATSSILGYTYSFSTDPSNNPATDESALTTTRIVHYSTPVAEGTYYFRVRAMDAAGNWTNPPAQFVYKFKRDSINPDALDVNFGASAVEIPRSNNLKVAVRPDATFQIPFSESMNPTYMEAPGNITLTAVRNNRGESVTQPIDIRVRYDDTSRSAIVSLASPLPYGHRFELRTTPNVVDLGGNSLSDQVNKVFYTVMDPNAENLLIAEDGQTRVSFPAQAWGEAFASPAINEDPKNAPMAALPAQIDKANDNQSQIHGAYAQTINLKEFNIYNQDGQRMQGSFTKEVEVRMTYPDADNNGIVDGSERVAPVRESVLALYWLDEQRGIWVRVPGSSVDKANNVITAKVKHFSVYGIIGAPATDLSEAYAYPVPFKTSLGHKEIVFNNLSSVANIKIYTLNGELVKELKENDGDGMLIWSPVANSSGEPLGSDVFFYIIENNQQKKKGKLIIVR